MRSLYFHEMMILSKTEKSAIRVKFSKTKNLILGENDVGKSTLIKSLYNCLGADTPQLKTSRWAKANPIYCLRFELNGNYYSIIRDERYFGVFDHEDNRIGQYQGVSSKRGIGQFINRLLGFRVSLESKDGNLVRLSPAFYFLPFYVDQDKGWGTAWSSFQGLQAIKSYRKTLVDYHLGIRSQAYYDAKAQLHDVTRRVREIVQERNSLIGVRDRYQSRKDQQHFDVDPETFKEEIEALVERLNSVLDRRQVQLDKIKHQRNSLLGLETEVEVLESAVRELEADYRYAEDSKTPDHVDCPTCGTEFENSIVERFGLLDDIDYCRNLIDQKQKKIADVVNTLQDLNEQYQETAKEANSVDALLQRKKESITVQEVIQSEGYKDVLRSISLDITELDREQAELESKKATLKKETQIDRELKESITTHYQRKMKEALNKLNVEVLQENDYKAPDRLVTTNATGSDAPRALLAQYISLLHTMDEYGAFVRCPLVIDSPFQQEQDDSNTTAIFDFITSETLEGEQLIVGTLNKHAPKLGDDHGCNIIKLSNKYHLLRPDCYDEVFELIEPLHRQTLEVDEPSSTTS